MYLELSGTERIEFVRELSKLEKMGRAFRLEYTKILKESSTGENYNDG